MGGVNTCARQSILPTMTGWSRPDPIAQAKRTHLSSLPHGNIFIAEGGRTPRQLPSCSNL